MNCLNPNCQNEVLTDFPLCNDCKTTRHFEYRKDCQCAPCQVERAEMNASELACLEAVAFSEELRLQYGRPVQAAA